MSLMLLAARDDQTCSLPSQAETRMKQNPAPPAPESHVQKKGSKRKGELSCGEDRVLGWDLGSWGLHPRLCAV